MSRTKFLTLLSVFASSTIIITVSTVASDSHFPSLPSRSTQQQCSTVDKAGATVMFQEANMGSNNIGAVVSPVRLESLEKFGSPQFVADKLIQAEKRKESTKEAEVIKFTERSGGAGLSVYEFEYIVDSPRGGMNFCSICGLKAVFQN